MRTLAPALLAAALLCASCDSTSVEPDSLGWTTLGDSLTLVATMPRAVIPVGETDTLTIELRNHSATDVRLDFGSTCQILPYVQRDDGEIRLPSGGGWGCGAMITSLTVPAHGGVVRRFAIATYATSPGPFGSAVTPGTYRVYATLDGGPQQPRMRSADIALEVR